MRNALAVAILMVMGSQLVPRPAHAQEVTAIPSPARIRVETTNGALVTGRVFAVHGDSVWVQPDRENSVVMFTQGTVRQYELSRGRDRWRGARRGALITGAISLIGVGLVLHDDLTTHDDIMIPSTLFAAPIGVLLTLLGTGVGAVSAGERWSPPQPWRGASVGPAMSRGVSLSYRFVF